MRRSYLLQSADRIIRTSLPLWALLALHAQTNPYALFQRAQSQQASPQAVNPDPSSDKCPEGMTALECESRDSQSTLPDSYVRPKIRYPLEAPTYSDLSGEHRRQDQQQTPGFRTVEPLTEFQKYVQSSTGHLLPIYGASLFDRVPSTFAPINQIAASPEYPIGPGDEIDLRVWGQVNFSQRLTVNPTGDIFLPQVGRINVVGLKFGQLQDAVRNAMGRIYRNFDLNVNMGQLRSMQIFILGQARRPGTYTVSSLSTLVNALFASGGPSNRGSLRKISLKRGNRLITTIDLYDLLLQGDKSSDVQLMSGDVIFIPEAGPRVAIDGSVESPAIFELKDDSSLAKLFSFAGGLTPVASGKRAILERVDDHATLHSEDVDLSQRGLEATHPQNGDIFRVLSVVPQFSRTVTLKGNVADPVRMPWHPGMKISELIPSKEALLTRGYWTLHNELLTPEDRQSISKEQKQEASAERPSDQPVGWMAAPQQSFREEARSTNADASLAAATENSGSLVIRQFNRKNDVQPMAPAIDWSYASIERLDPRDLSTHIIPFDLGKAVLDHDPLADLTLEPGDIVTILSEADVAIPRAEQTKYIRIEGEIKTAGIYSVNPGETLRDVVARAGGLTPNAYLFGAQFTRESTRREQQRRYSDFLDQLDRDINQSAANLSGRLVSVERTATAQSSISDQRALVARLRQTAASGRIVLDVEPDSTGVNALPQIPLENGDRLFIPHTPSTVNVVGMVYNQAAFLYASDLRLGDYLHDAGGPSRYADRGRVFVIRADGSVVSRETRAHLFSANFDSLRMYPGDTLVMPTNVLKTTLLRSLLDWSQVLSNFGIGAAAVNVLK